MNHLKASMVECIFDENTGDLKELRKQDTAILMNGFSFDIGCNEEMKNAILKYHSFLNFRTWELPEIDPEPVDEIKMPNPVISVQEGVLNADYLLNGLKTRVEYKIVDDALQIRMFLKNISNDIQYINGCAFIINIPCQEVKKFDFPANAPCAHFDIDKMELGNVIQTGLINFATHIQMKNADLNLLFIDEIEKSGCGVWRDEKECHFCYHAGVEANLEKNQEIQVGNLYLLPCMVKNPELTEDQNPYLKIRNYIEKLGYHACTDGIHEGVMYSCHPSGTMDKDFPLKQDLFEYAGYLPVLKQIGFDHVWLLPVFDHDEKGVYHSNDQSLIAERYGGEEGCKYYCDKAHENGMTVLFDYVPHGPVPEYPLVKDNPEWPSKRRDGSLQNEWDCVSMDYNHPGYIRYTTNLVKDHVDRFKINGARIDCAMGGLSNWKPYGGNRPSGNSVEAGVHITEAVRNGFLEGGQKPLNLPENFNPLPVYYHCTDLFYGMNLYRAFVELEPLLKEKPEQFVALLTDYLEREAWVTPENYHKMRFLGNHDTVSWVWQAKRPRDCYGDDGAKALFAVISLIDGVPMIYQGDENPEIYGGTGENLTAYFTMLFAHRKKLIPVGSNKTTYLHTGNSLMAFVRETADIKENEENPYESKGSSKLLVVVNLSEREQALELETLIQLAGAKIAELAAESCGNSTDLDRIQGYQYKLFKI